MSDSIHLDLQYFRLVSSSKFNVDSGKGNTHTGVGDTSLKLTSHPPMLIVCTSML